MKKAVFTLVVCVTISLSGYAQLNKGNWLVGGSFNVNSENIDDNQPSMQTANKRTNLTIYPRVGWFVSQRLAVGLLPSYSYYREETSSLKARNNAYSIAPFVRYYKPLSEKWAIFGDFTGVSYTRGSNRREENLTTFPVTTENNYQSYNIGIFVSPGVTYFITPKVGVEASLGSVGYWYSHQVNTTKHGDQESKLITNSHTANINLRSLIEYISIGIQFYL